MTSTPTTSRVEIRMMGMSTSDLTNYVQHAADWPYTQTDAEQARTARFAKLAQTELNRRVTAGGR